MPAPVDDTVVRVAEPGVLGARPTPVSLVRAVVDELVEAAVTIGEDVEEIVEETVGEVLAATGRSLRVLRDAADRRAGRCGRRPGAHGPAPPLELTLRHLRASSTSRCAGVTTPYLVVV